MNIIDPDRMPERQGVHSATTGGPGSGSTPGSSHGSGQRKYQSRGGGRGGSKGGRGNPENMNRKKNMRPGGRPGKGGGRRVTNDDYTSDGGTRHTSQGQGALEPEEVYDGTSQSEESETDSQHMETEETPPHDVSQAPGSADPMVECADAEGNVEGGNRAYTPPTRVASC